MNGYSINNNSNNNNNNNGDLNLSHYHRIRGFFNSRAIDQSSIPVISDSEFEENGDIVMNNNSELINGNTINNGINRKDSMSPIIINSSPYTSPESSSSSPERKPSETTESGNNNNNSLYHNNHQISKPLNNNDNNNNNGKVKPNRMDIVSLIDAAAVIEHNEKDAKLGSSCEEEVNDVDGYDENEEQNQRKKRRTENGSFKINRMSVSALTNNDDDDDKQVKKNHSNAKENLLAWFEEPNCNSWDLVETIFTCYIAQNLDTVLGLDNRFKKINILNLARTSGLPVDGAGTLTIPGSNSSTRGNSGYGNSNILNAFESATVGQNRRVSGISSGELQQQQQDQIQTETNIVLSATALDNANTMNSSSSGNGHEIVAPSSVATAAAAASSSNCTVQIGKSLAVLEAIRQITKLVCPTFEMKNLGIDDNNVGRLEELRVSDDYSILRSVFQMLMMTPAANKHNCEFLLVAEDDLEIRERTKLLHRFTNGIFPVIDPVDGRVKLESIEETCKMSLDSDDEEKNSSSNKGNSGSSGKMLSSLTRKENESNKGSSSNRGNKKKNNSIDSVPGVEDPRYYGAGSVFPDDIYGILNEMFQYTQKVKYNEEPSTTTTTTGGGIIELIETSQIWKLFMALGLVMRTGEDGLVESIFNDEDVEVMIQYALCFMDFEDVCRWGSSCSGIMDGSCYSNMKTRCQSLDESRNYGRINKLSSSSSMNENSLTTRRRRQDNNKSGVVGMSLLSGKLPPHCYTGAGSIPMILLIGVHYFLEYRKFLEKKSYEMKHGPNSFTERSRYPDGAEVELMLFDGINKWPENVVIRKLVDNMM